MGIQSPNRHQGAKPPRTFGLSIAILASVVLFSVLPMLQVLIVNVVQARFNNVDLAMGADGEAGIPLIGGARIEGVSNAGLTIQIALGIAYLPLAFLAWRGRPRQIRFVIVAMVVGLTILTLLVAILMPRIAPNAVQGIDSSGDLQRQLLITRTLVSIGIALYVVWYMNRAPARAFYRGSYLTARE